jgi:hypothetical protein
MHVSYLAKCMPERHFACRFAPGSELGLLDLAGHAKVFIIAIVGAFWSEE